MTVLTFARAKSGRAFVVSDTVAYGYNIRSELISAAKLVGGDDPGAPQTATTEYAYQYDDIGNRITSLDLGTNRTYTANKLNQYTQISNLCDSASLREEFIPQFDDDGNQALIKTATGVWQVLYNGENRPILWTQGTNTITMSYDRQGRRVTKNDQRFVYDGYLQIADNGGNAYIWDPTEPVATLPLVWNLSTFQPFNFSTSYYTQDGNKNVSEVVAAYSALAAHYEYAPFGAVVVQRGASAASNPWRFSSEYAEDDTATVYYNYRHYESVMGRWMNADFAPSEIAGVNKYAYCYNYPLSLTDYIGLAGETTHGTIKCSDTDSCIDLATKLTAWIKHYEERHKELLEDKLNLKINDPHRYNNHIEEAVKAIKNINRCVTRFFHTSLLAAVHLRQSPNCLLCQNVFLNLQLARRLRSWCHFRIKRFGRCDADV